MEIKAIMISVRNYNPTTDYAAIKALYQDSSTYGGQYDDARDTDLKLAKLIKAKPSAILVAEKNDEIVGTVTLFEDGRSAWLYRFAVKADEDENSIVKALNEKALSVLKEMGHSQVLVYAPAGNQHFEERYTNVGFTKGNNYTAYWRDI